MSEKGMTDQKASIPGILSCEVDVGASALSKLPKWDEPYMFYESSHTAVGTRLMTCS